MNRRAIVWGGQAILAVVVGAFVWRSLSANWEEFRNIDVQLSLRPAWIGLAAVTVWTTYAVLVEAWRRVLGGWDERIRFPIAVRVWAVSNLGRYLPGKIWSVAGLAVLAQRAGVSGWAAAGSAGVMQALAVATGIAVVTVAVPRAVSPVWLAAGALIAVGIVAGLAWPRTVQLMSRLVRREIRPIRPAALTVAAVATALSWIFYGAAFWMLARGIVGTGDLALSQAIGVFAAGYITGLLALFAPGGVGVREIVFIGLLTPALGSGGAVAVGVASRILLTLTEAGAAGVGLFVRDDATHASG